MTERSITKKAVGFLPHKVKENIPGNAYDFLTYNQVLFGEGQQRKIFEFSMFFCFFSSTVSTDCLLWVCLTLSYTLRVPTGNSISSSMSLCLIAFFFFLYKQSVNLSKDFWSLRTPLQHLMEEQANSLRSSTKNCFCILNYISSCLITANLSSLCEHIC